MHLCRALHLYLGFFIVLSTRNVWAGECEDIVSVRLKEAGSTTAKRRSDQLIQSTDRVLRTRSLAEYRVAVQAWSALGQDLSGRKRKWWPAQCDEAEFQDILVKRVSKHQKELISDSIRVAEETGREGKTVDIQAELGDVLDLKASYWGQEMNKSLAMLSQLANRDDADAYCEILGENSQDRDGPPETEWLEGQFFSSATRVRNFLEERLHVLEFEDVENGRRNSATECSHKAYADFLASVEGADAGEWECDRLSEVEAQLESAKTELGRATKSLEDKPVYNSALDQGAEYMDHLGQVHRQRQKQCLSRRRRQRARGFTIFGLTAGSGAAIGGAVLAGITQAKISNDWQSSGYRVEQQRRTRIGPAALWFGGALMVTGTVTLVGLLVTDCGWHHTTCRQERASRSAQLHPYLRLQSEGLVLRF